MERPQWKLLRAVELDEENVLEILEWPHHGVKGGNVPGTHWVRLRVQKDYESLQDNEYFWGHHARERATTSFDKRLSAFEPNQG